MKKFQHIYSNAVITEEQLNKLWKELPSPLFTTEDGVEIFDGGTLIWPTRKTKGLADIFPIYKNYCLPLSVLYRNSNTTDSVWKWFSTNEARKKWIDEQYKPLLTTEDGNPKYLDEKCWAVREKDFKAYYVSKGLDENSPWTGYKYFDVEYNAMNYIKDNKPTFSAIDIEKAINETYIELKCYSTFYENIKRKFIAKLIEKLKKLQNP